MNIFVAKLNSQTTSDDLTQLFSQFGNVSDSKVIMDRETGRSKCFGFIEMDDEAEGTAAIEQLNETDFMGSNIVVKKSEPRAEQPRRSFDRRQGGGGRHNDNRRNDRRERGGGDRRSFNRDRDDYNRY